MDSKLIKKYYAGECSLEEVQEVLDWFKSKELEPEQEQDLYWFWQEADQEKEDRALSKDAPFLFASIMRTIENQERDLDEEEKEGGKVKMLNHCNWMLKAAAALVLPAIFVWLLTSHFVNKESVAPELVTVEAEPGTHKKILLEDGSTIFLHAGSSVSYLQHFPNHKREIVLQGEAFFEVAKDSLRPFIVKSGVLLTQALGTSFNIRYRQEDKNISVALATGVVKVEKQEGQNTAQLVKLLPGQQLGYNIANKNFTVCAYEPQEVLSWRKGILYFKKANIEQIIYKLENWYGVDIEVTGKVPTDEDEWFYTGAYDNQNLESVLDGIGFVKYFSYKKEGDKVYIMFN
ncbi:FecR family protein [Pontibacter harenae]|uniref:FecR family protein n=1 Tax=Pontibacter harenae TaxID=2894083 RepID=UPI001E4DE4E7|nr:FecR family protein [Pontibacter harenae]MCC9167590.1 FecR domain-containing protein [Pontibacter harenae]